MPVSKIDPDKCIGCGTCVESCPMDVFRLDTGVDCRLAVSPCSAACALGPGQREYHDLLKMGMVDEAAAVLAECHPMPAITGRLCAHPCEGECSRSAVDAPVNINALEQYLGDHLLEAFARADSAAGARAAAGEGRVAVIGSGPAGLSAAYFLARDGFAVTVFEREERLGGLLRTAVPSFRLPEDVLDAQIAHYRKLGVEFRTGVQVGRDVTVESLRAEGYGAVIAATGAAKPVGLTAAGSDAAGVLNAMEFLATAKNGGVTCAGESVAVIGGGSVALDAARTAVRLGAARVTVVCLERLEPGIKDGMLATVEEIIQAQEEGVEILPARGVHSFAVKDGRVSGIGCVDCLSVRDGDGRFAPVYGTCVLPESVEADRVVIATGQVPDIELVPAGFSIETRGRIVAGPDASAFGPGLFAAGDAVTGASTVVQALAAGKRAAGATARYLRHEETPETEEASVAAPPSKEKMELLDRTERALRPAAERRTGFAEVTASLARGEARLEAERCLTCGSRSRIAYSDDCQVCRLCQKYCPTDAIDVTDGQLLGSLFAWNVVELGR